ncbi:MAG TPA: bifunctional phosphopantothenoylcysteine decarboxylase/phosphopantothenate--cysteine ligase CoaBC [Vicinamibacterales bacterium]|jgi:phosphopantothenoylcysteine decarboxylase/phosphopantothenate--cysteine ligase|nr:bifunctional phosphopantothenoylcysteine decarboxylase/phosphopantothenate--cysteine ligase CoaBC [Vicinamibacterales bacterium]
MALIALGVTGGIGAYKAVEVCRGLQKRGHDVQAVMTRAARRFVAPLTFEAITRHPVITSQWRPGMNADIEHIAIADHADLLLVAPCTANVLGKFANGIADDFLTSLYLATRAPVLVAPAMNSNMLGHAAVQANLQLLQRRGVLFVDPGEGYLACGWIGKGRLAEPEEIVEAAIRVLEGRSATPGPAVDSALRGRKVLITAGPTYEDIDPVRYVGNRSSGRMGFALAADAVRRGAEVTLVAGPTTVTPPAVATLVRVRSAAEMHEAVMKVAAGMDLVVMSAAVADYTPSRRAPGKIAKGDTPLTLTLERTRDILADLGALRASTGAATPVLVGFAAETDDVVRKAQGKRARKRVDAIVANDVSQSDRGFDVDTNAVTIVTADAEDVVPLQSKDRVAAVILDSAERLLRRATSAAPAR